MSLFNACTLGINYYAKDCYIEQIDIDDYSENDYQKVLKKHEQALLYQKWIKANKPETIKFEMID